MILPQAIRNAQTTGTGGGDTNVYYLEPMDKLEIAFSDLGLQMEFEEMQLELTVEEITDLVMGNNQTELNVEMVSNDLYIE